jgi:hypothetical protein
MSKVRVAGFGLSLGGKRISIYIHFDRSFNQKEALVLPLFSY